MRLPLAASHGGPLSFTEFLVVGSIFLLIGFVLMVSMLRRRR